MGSSIYKRKDGRWEARLTIKKDDQKTYRSFYGRTKKEADEKRKKANEQMMLTEGKEELTVETASKIFLQSKNSVKVSSYSSYSYVITGYIIPKFGNYKVSEVTMDKKQNYIKELEEKGYNQSTIRQTIQILNSILGVNDAVQTCMKYKAEEQKELEYIVDDDFEKMINFIKLSSSNDNEYIGVIIMAYTGIKISELCAIKWENINFESRKMNINQEVQRVKASNGENHNTRLGILDIKERSIYLPDALYDILLKKKDKNNLYVLTGDKTNMEPRTYQYRLKKLKKTLEIPKLTANSIRNTFAIRALKAGVNSKVLAEVLGVNLNGLIKYWECVNANPETEMKKIK